MFEKARLKLTAWYLLIIMAVSITFSFVIYRVLLNEIIRFEKAQRFRIERRMQFFQRQIPDNPELIEEIKQRLLLRLILVNAYILIISGGLGYILAGRTLSPIKEMVDEQNRFISDASHQLRTPLTSLKSATEVHLRDKNLTLKDAKTLLSDNLEDVKKLENLTNALLEMSRFQKINHNRSFEPVKINEIAKVSIRKIKPLAKKKNIQIKNQTGDISVEGLKQELTDLLVILLDNAVKYTSVKKTICIESKKTDGKVLISVKDAGIGIDKNDIPFIFDRFYRAQKAKTKSAEEGYGLGLSIAQKIVKLHGGTIDVRSVLGQGSTFTVHLPVKQSKLI